jgi:hypothetical protein
VSRPAIPLPGTYVGYEVAIDAFSNKTLSLYRHTVAGDSRTLGVFNLTTIENGLVLDAWNMLRVLLVGGEITVWFNPSFPETGFVGNISDAERIPKPLPPRLKVVDPEPAPPGLVVVSAGRSPTRIDYISVLPPSVVS